MNFTPEQEAILDAVSLGDNCHVEALAGCAKSFTIRHSLTRIPPNRQVFIGAFNKKIKEEMEKEVAALRAEWTGPAFAEPKIMTLNGLGHKAIATALRRQPELDTDKIFKLTKETNLKKQDFSDCMALVKAARMAGLIPKGTGGRALIQDTPEAWAEIADAEDIDPILATPAREVLKKCYGLAMQGIIDFDDQLVVSTLLFGTYPKYDVLFVDEAQDLSPINHMQVRNAAKSQIIAVGDSHQAIYAWRGADSNSMRNIRSLRDAWTDLTLSVTFRCPSTVVRRQQSYVPNFRAGPDNLQGSIERLTEWHPEGGSNSAILCRNNAPLIRLAFQLLRSQVPVNYLGKDIGANLKRLYVKLSKNGKLELDTVRANALAYGQQNPDKIDKADSLIAVLESFSDVDSAMKFLGDAKKNSITLATGHKAKGMEWNTVYHLNQWLIPSKWVKEMEPDDSGLYGDDEPPADYGKSPAWERYRSALAQENNLRYVIETRTKDKLRFVNLENLQ